MCEKILYNSHRMNFAYRCAVTLRCLIWVCEQVMHYTVTEMRRREYELLNLGFKKQDLCTYKKKNLKRCNYCAVFV